MANVNSPPSAGAPSQELRLPSVPDSLPRASQWGLIGATTLITVGMIFAIVRLLNKMDETRLVQISIRRVEAHANLISSIGWETMARRKTTPALLAELRHAEEEIQQATDALAVKKQ